MNDSSFTDVDNVIKDFYSCMTTSATPVSEHLIPELYRDKSSQLHTSHPSSSVVPETTSDKTNIEPEAILVHIPEAISSINEDPTREPIKHAAMASGGEDYVIKKAKKAKKKKISLLAQNGEGISVSPSNPVDTVQPEVVVTKVSRPEQGVPELANQINDLTAEVARLRVKQKKSRRSRRHRSSSSSSSSSSNSSSSSDDSSRKHKRRSQNTPICLSNGAQITIKKAKRAQQGRFVDFNEFLPAPSLAHFLIAKEGHHKLKGKNLIGDYFSWLTAFTGYMEVVLDLDPSLWREMMRYRMTIMNFDIRFRWATVLQYDMAFRAKMAMTRSINFGHVDPDLSILILTPDSLKVDPKVCFRCKNPLHFAGECPFAPSHAMETSQAETYRPTAPRGRSRPFRGGRSQNWHGTGGRIDMCYKWNRGNCDQGNACLRAHVCATCGGPNPKNQCPFCTQRTHWGGNAGSSQRAQPPNANVNPGQYVHNFNAQQGPVARPNGQPP